MFLYIISDGTDAKIGVSKQPEKRLKSLQTGSPKKLILYATYEILDKNPFGFEKKCHEAISKSYQKRGEWFASPNLWDLQCIIEELYQS